MHGQTDRQVTIIGASLSEPHTSHVSGAFPLNVISYVRRAAYSMFT